MPLANGAIFAGYRILGLLGAGGMGEVYLAEHPRLPRRDALKVLPVELSANREFRDRFNREADLVAALYHPHIIGVHDRGDTDGQLWISMDFIDGPDSGRLMRERYPGGIPRAQVVEIVAAVSDALDYAHRQGLLHRDIKPANILLTDPSSGTRRILLADFGIARAINETSGLTATNVVLGTVTYAAPEQLTGQPLDGRADQYALALIVANCVWVALCFGILATRYRDISPLLASLAQDSAVEGRGDLRMQVTGRGDTVQALAASTTGRATVLMGAGMLPTDLLSRLAGGLHQLLADAADQDLVLDATLAQNPAQAEALWHIRESIPDAQKPEGLSVKHDVSLPIHLVPRFVEQASQLVAEEVPGIRVVAFGHVGDGNVHFNLSQPIDMERAAFARHKERLSALVHDLTMSMSGSFSAEHGIGQLKRDELRRYRSPVELDVMRKIKQALDPAGLMNPGKVL
mgnify:CR=1 FL=1